MAKKQAKRNRAIGVFYMSIPGRAQNPNWSKKGNPVLTTKRPSWPLKFVYVRCEVIKGAKDLIDALDRAKPRRGENVMNSHYIN